MKVLNGVPIDLLAKICATSATIRDHALACGWRNPRFLKIFGVADSGVCSGRVTSLSTGAAPQGGKARDEVTEARGGADAGASAFPRPADDACDDDHPHAAPLQKEVARQSRSTLRSAQALTSHAYYLFDDDEHPTKQRRRRNVCDDHDDHGANVYSHISCVRGAACTSSQPRSTGNAAPVAGESAGRGSGSEAREAVSIPRQSRALTPGTSTPRPRPACRTFGHARAFAVVAHVRRAGWRGESHRTRLPRAPRTAPRRWQWALPFAEEPQREGACDCEVEHACSKRESACLSGTAVRAPSPLSLRMRRVEFRWRCAAQRRTEIAADARPLRVDRASTRRLPAPGARPRDDLRAARGTGHGASGPTEREGRRRAYVPRFLGNQGM
ncbi:hypothetical protein DFH09DRAFT_1104379 [Mycena vulgaris]|nr:hypothetical protein DFH09DRAFT_1104379 [Mycena vulgaris]